MRIPDLENLKKVFCRYREIRAVYMFGSRASGRVHRESDLDLAVLQDGDGLQEKKLDILAQLAAEGFCEVDLVFLPKDNIVLQYEAIRMNHVVYQRPDFDRGSTYSLVVRQYLDFLPFLEVQRKALKERLLNDKA
jgi:predicted nucleotidyltransferase